MIIPEGVKVYGSGKIKAKAGQELPEFLKNVDGFEKKVTKAGEKYAENKKKEKAEKTVNEKPVEEPAEDSNSFFDKPKDGKK